MKNMVDNEAMQIRLGTASILNFVFFSFPAQLTDSAKIIQQCKGDTNRLSTVSVLVHLVSSMPPDKSLYLF